MALICEVQVVIFLSLLLHSCYLIDIHEVRCMPYRSFLFYYCKEMEIREALRCLSSKLSAGCP